MNKRNSKKQRDHTISLFIYKKSDPILGTNPFFNEIPLIYLNKSNPKIIKNIIRIINDFFSGRGGNGNKHKWYIYIDSEYDSISKIINPNILHMDTKEALNLIDLQKKITIYLDENYPSIRNTNKSSQPLVVIDDGLFETLRVKHYYDFNISWKYKN